MSKRVIIVFLGMLMLLASSSVFAFEKEETFLPLGGHITYGSYSNSNQRESIISETMNCSYLINSSSIPVFNSNLDFKLCQSNLTRKFPLSKIKGISSSLTYSCLEQLKTTDYLGARISATYIKSDDKNSNNTLIPYGSLIYKSSDFSKYLDFGYSRTAYKDTTIDQITLTGGTALFNWRTWLQTRLYYISLNKKVQEKDRVLAIEERFTYYAIPQRLSLAFYGMLGKRIYAYDPDLEAAYNLSDIQKGSGGLSATYNLTKALSMFGDITYEAYENKDISNDYSVTLPNFRDEICLLIKI
ncbi:hypothetical protein KKB84_00245 [bacterium]|nr:hypothetical protein [bacterium]MBU1152397.1 hypothetical protein [bacterium]MBU1782371.1 hypothetical protein [bacterium]